MRIPSLRGAQSAQPVIFSFQWTGKAVGVNRRLIKARNGRFVLSPAYRAFKDSLHLTINTSGRPVAPHQGTLHVTVYQESNHDCDALLKPVIDAMEAAGVLKDDKQVMSITVRRIPKLKRTHDDHIEVSVREYADEEA